MAVADAQPESFAPSREQTAVTSCGELGFQVVCTNDTPYLGSHEGKYGLQILDIFYDNASLIVADVHELHDLHVSRLGCYFPTNNGTNKVDYPFSISPSNQNLIFYNCTKAPAVVQAAGEGLVETRCRRNMFVSIAESYDELGGYGLYSLDGCEATVVPVLRKCGEANATEQLIRDGFLLTWLPPTSGGFTR
ncbi:hypothetical protein ACP4OV_021993 [Aristida adscensionis]